MSENPGVDGSSIDVSAEVETEWVIGWKIVKAYLADDLRTFRFNSVYVAGAKSYGVDADGVCFKVRDSHAAVPADDCKCGFNAWHEIHTAMDELTRYCRYRTFENRSDMVLARVGLCGDVVEGVTFQKDRIWHSGGRRHEPKLVAGYRASKQRTVDIFYPKECLKCGKEADCLASSHSIRYGDDIGWTLYPFCRRHVQWNYRVQSISELERHNDVDIHWH